MPRIKPLSEKDYPSEIKIAFIQHTTVYNSRITNMKATLGHSGTAFKAYMQWYPLFEEVKAITGLRLATLFAWSISEAADCPLCSTYFRKMIIEAGESPEALVVSDEEQALLTFGAAIARNRGFVEDAEFVPVRKRYTDSEIVLLTAFAGIMIATNIFNNVNGTEIDTYLNPFKPENTI
ncbi:carboxymuconolactone decarboxylase family protein [Dyadobacter sp. OTU695]|uniref:carboxymuconolactone decarboxylase family protein n=1 Tax=Dyadobacter sp. OTU695 TaxID=3043860 RepID=UPI00313EFBC4